MHRVRSANAVTIDDAGSSEWGLRMTRQSDEEPSQAQKATQLVHDIAPSVRAPEKGRRALEASSSVAVVLLLTFGLNHDPCIRPN
jgi:hypothetical protein